MDQGQWRIIEPIMKVEVICPTEFATIVTAQITTRQGLLISTDNLNDWHSLVAEVGFVEPYWSRQFLGSRTIWKTKKSDGMR